MSERERERLSIGREYELVFSVYMRVHTHVGIKKWI